MPFVQGRSLRDVSAVHSAAFDRPSRTQVFTVEIRVGPISDCASLRTNRTVVCSCAGVRALVSEPLQQADLLGFLLFVHWGE